MFLIKDWFWLKCFQIPALVGKRTILFAPILRLRIELYVYLSYFLQAYPKSEIQDTGTLVVFETHCSGPISEVITGTQDQRLWILDPRAEILVVPGTRGTESWICKLGSKIWDTCHACDLMPRTLIGTQ